MIHIVRHTFHRLLSADAGRMQVCIGVFALSIGDVIRYRAAGAEFATELINHCVMLSRAASVTQSTLFSRAADATPVSGPITM